ncbi:hypothetical protein TNCV_3556421 [Trichonephila clavipes]|nr:hypothetical protein TNCV_3556421 [Trichonephila clavipes]
MRVWMSWELKEFQALPTALFSLVGVEGLQLVCLPSISYTRLIRLRSGELITERDKTPNAAETLGPGPVGPCLKMSLPFSCHKDASALYVDVFPTKKVTFSKIEGARRGGRPPTLRLDDVEKAL